MTATGRIATEHGFCNYIDQVAPIRTQSDTWFLGFTPCSVSPNLYVSIGSAAVFARFIHPRATASISQDYIGGHKGRLEVWGTEVPQRGPGRSPVRGSGGRSPPRS